MWCGKADVLRAALDMRSSAVANALRARRASTARAAARIAATMRANGCLYNKTRVRRRAAAYVCLSLPRWRPSARDAAVTMRVAALLSRVERNRRCPPDMSRKTKIYHMVARRNVPAAREEQRVAIYARRRFQIIQPLSRCPTISAARGAYRTRIEGRSGFCRPQTPAAQSVERTAHRRRG